MKKALMVVLPVLISIGSASRLAAQPEPETSPEAPSPTSTSLAPAQRGTAPVETHGFASQGFILTTGNDFLAPNTTNGSFEFSEAGLNVTTEIGDNLRIGIQAFAQNISQNSNFTFRADWFYVDYRFRDWLGIRAGRLKIPFGLYNEISDIDAARAPILLPQSVYPLQGREFLFAQTGGEVYGFVRTPAAGALDTVSMAARSSSIPRLLLSPGSTIDLRFYVKYVVGGRLFWETPLEGLRVGVSLLAARLDLTEFQDGMVAGSIRVRSALALGSAEYTHDRLMLTAEYSRWSANQESDIPSATQSLTSERAYAMVSIRATPGFSRPPTTRSISLT